MNIDDANLSPRGSTPYGVVKRPSRLERRGSVAGVFTEQERNAVIQAQVAQTVLRDPLILRERSGSASAHYPIAKAVSSPPALERTEAPIRAIVQELVETFKRYMQPAESHPLTSSGNRLSGLFKSAHLRSSGNHESSHSYLDLRPELEIIFSLMERCRSNGITMLEIPVKDEIKRYRLDALLEVITKNDTVLKTLEHYPQTKRWLHGYVVNFILEDFNLKAKELLDFLQRLSVPMEEMVKVFGRGFELDVNDESHRINVFDKFVNIDSPTLLLKNVAVARINAENLMLSVRRGEKSEKMVTRSGEDREFDLQDTSLIYDTGFEVYKTLVEMLLPAIKFTEEAISSLANEILSRYYKAGNMSREEMQSFKGRLKDSWPVGDNQTNVLVNWENVLQLVKGLVTLVRTNESFFKHSEWIRKCIGDITSPNISQHIYGVGDQLILNPVGFFKDLGEDDITTLRLYFAALVQDLTRKLENDPLKLDILKRKTAEINDLL